MKLGAIGDVASVLPAAWKLRESGMDVDWLCGRTVAPLLSCYSWVRPILVDDVLLLNSGRINSALEIARTWVKLFGSSYDLCAILQYDSRYRILTVPVRARKTILLSRHIREFRLVSERHHTAEFARILMGEPDEYKVENHSPLPPDRLPANPVPSTGTVRIVLAPGGARNLQNDDMQRRWPITNYTTLARLLLERGYEVALSGGPSDTWVNPAFAALALDNYVGRFSLPETLAFYQSVDCVVTHDTGPLHLAGLAGCCILGLFGPTAPSKALPRRAGVRALWGGERLPCRPCYDGKTFAPCNKNGCMEAISPERAFDEVESLLAAKKENWLVTSL